MTAKLEKWQWEHGTRATYQRHGCRCVKCTQANTEHSRKYREKKNAVGVEVEVVKTKEVVRPRDTDRQNDWMSFALCAETDPDLFFPEKGDWTGSQSAREVCGRCKVVSQCREWGLTATAVHYEDETGEVSEMFLDGVIGGLTAVERQQERVRLGYSKTKRTLRRTV